MYFDLEGRSFETPTVESAMSWREQVLLSIFVHLLAALLVVFVPQLPLVREAAERRAERLREMAEAAELRAAVVPPAENDSRSFIFVQPRIELEPEVAPTPDAVLSDRDRTAQSPLRTLDPESRLPVSEGNSPEFVIADEEPTDDLDPVEREGAVAAAGGAETISSPSDDPDRVPVVEDGEGSTLAASSLTQPGTGLATPAAPDDRRIDLTSDAVLGRAVENLRQRVRRETFRNYSGDTGQFGPDIQFDTKGVEFGPWLRRFVAQIKRNWTVPYAIWSMHGHVVLTFNVQDNGSLTELTVVRPSHVDGFNNSAYNALRSSNPTQPLPPEYPDDHVFFTATFYFNERPPAQ